MRNVKDDITPKIVFGTSLNFMFVPPLSNQIYANDNDFFGCKSYDAKFEFKLNEIRKKIV